MMDNSTQAVGLDDWLRWQVPLCALVIIIPAFVSVIIIRRADRGPLRSSHFWVPCWRNLNPLWLLFFRVLSFTFMVLLLSLIALQFGPVVFFFYTQWTFALVVLYFAIGTIISTRGCWMDLRKPVLQSGDRDTFLKKDSDESEYESIRKSEVSIKPPCHHNLVQIDQRRLGFLESAMQIVYQICGGAVMLTDIVFWCILLPFMSGESFQLTLLIGSMHSVNAVLLLIDSILNSLPFPGHGFTYFVLWSCAYIVFQWSIHAFFGVAWWPYPFLELSTPWSPLWYLGIALVHVPCYAFYVLVVKAKDSAFSRMFPHVFVRVLASSGRNSVELTKKKKKKKKKNI